MTNAVQTPNGVKPTEETAIYVPQIRLQQWEMQIVGVTSLITNRFSDEEMDAIERAQTKQPKLEKPPRNPQEEFEGHIHRLPNGRPCFPAWGIRKAWVQAGYRQGSEKGTELRGRLTIPVDYIEIIGPEPKRRRDWVRLTGGMASLAYRPEFMPWEMVVPVLFNADAIVVAQVLNIFQLTGMGGIGSWTPQKEGTHGVFKLGEVRQIS